MLGAAADAWRERAAERRAHAAPRALREPHVPRSRLGAALEARLAVRAGVRLDDFLRSRLAGYAAALPVTLEELPVSIDVEGGEPIVRARPRGPAGVAGHGRPAPAQVPAAAELAFAGALVAREGPYAARELRDAEAALDALDARAAATSTRMDALTAAITAALASGALAARPDVEATAEQRGRPPIPSPVPLYVLRGGAAALLLAVAWRFAGPVLAAAGVHGSPEAALAQASAGAAFALLLALGAAAATLAFAGVALGLAADAVEEATGPQRRALVALSASCAGLASIAAGTAAAARDGRLQLALVLALPFAGALLWRWSTRLQRVRAGALDAALAWDRERAAEAVERGRRLEALEAERVRLAALDAERERVRRRLQALHRRAVDAERQVEIAGRAAARRLDRLSESLAGALELDRYLFVRLAAERDHVAAAPAVRPSRLGAAAAVATDRLGIAG